MVQWKNSFWCRPLTCRVRDYVDRTAVVQSGPLEATCSWAGALRYHRLVSRLPGCDQHTEYVLQGTQQALESHAANASDPSGYGEAQNAPPPNPVPSDFLPKPSKENEEGDLDGPQAGVVYHYRHDGRP